ncbi:zinc finger bed domain-containing protein daysleeper [Quercus suber]|uniref:Zinc finger bed domain-containing protein daysleeper n=1 Tax=Quercus suber TaxID=58331 RepID=A0AAW0JYQ7_QUESU
MGGGVRILAEYQNHLKRETLFLTLVNGPTCPWIIAQVVKTTPSMEIVDPITPTDDIYEPLCLEAQPNKRRRKKSIVWEHFTLETYFAREICKCQIQQAPELVVQELQLIHQKNARDRLAQDALGAMRETIQKIRDSVKYVKTSESHEDKFIELKQQLRVPSSKNLLVDDQTMWNTTYHMLVAACELKEVFSCLDTVDPDYKIAPSMEEWKQVETLCTYLKHLFDAALILTDLRYPAANTFFHEVSKIHIELTHAAMSEDPFVSNLIRPLLEKFDKYWKACYLVLAIAVVLDPRFKMKLVEFNFNKMYDEHAESWIRAVNDSVHELFLEYIAQALPLPALEEGNEGVIKTETSQDGFQEGNLVSNVDGLSDFEIYINEITSSQHMKSELDQYLEESLLPREHEFDILGWWKLNKLKYPTLSRMASDILSIPVCTVGPDSVFDTELRKMDNYRNSLGPMTLEALICAKDWLQCGLSPSTTNTTATPEISKAIVKMEV